MRPEINCPRRAYGPNRRAPNPPPCCCRRRPARVRGAVCSAREGQALQIDRAGALQSGEEEPFADDGFARVELYFDDLHIVAEYFVVYFFTAHAALLFGAVFLKYRGASGLFQVG